jgi:hypothetical protein
MRYTERRTGQKKENEVKYLYYFKKSYIIYMNQQIRTATSTAKEIKSMLLNHTAYIKNNGGATIKDGSIVEYTQGYQVGTLDGKEITSAVLGELLIIADILELDTLGLWYSDASNLWYMDTSSVYIEDKAQAMQLGRDNKQLAIFDWSTKNDIKL